MLASIKINYRVFFFDANNVIISSLYYREWFFSYGCTHCTEGVKLQVGESISSAKEICATP